MWAAAWPLIATASSYLNGEKMLWHRCAMHGHFDLMTVKGCSVTFDLKSCPGCCSAPICQSRFIFKWWEDVMSSIGVKCAAIFDLLAFKGHSVTFNLLFLWWEDVIV